MDLGHPYLTEQLIAYIGNKRSLLPFLHGIFHSLVADPTAAVFLDPFAGSGSVSRLARLMGFGVRANDWEHYSWVINACHLGIGASDVRSLFPGAGGLETVLADLNSSPALPDDQAYIARHYAPRDTSRADWRTERLFYTRENALAIDALRSRIEEMYPGVPADPTAAREKLVLLAPLLYEAATHTNTSGVFKACHRGFGGHGRDALSRILAPIRLRSPVLVDAPGAAEVSSANAADFLRGRGGDICYVDPPYASHQYGSNYFMLNSIARWDKPTVSEERGTDGRLVSKAGIRSDWPRTRSAFCYRESALPALREIVDAADCRSLVVSYSNEGLIGVEEMCDLLAETGDVRVVSTAYVKYPGGKQSLGRTTRNRELAFIVERGRVRGAGLAGAAARAVLAVDMAQLTARSFDPRRIRAAFPCESGSLVVTGGDGVRTLFPMRHFWRFAAEVDVDALGGDTRGFLERLRECAVRDVRDEIGVIIGILAGVQSDRERAALLREATRLLNKLAHGKNAAAFADALRALEECRAPAGAERSFAERLGAIARKAETRAAASRPWRAEKEMPR